MNNYNENHTTMSNPIMKADYPDPDVIRVGDTYYMVSTTMHFMPGAVILRSYDLLHWETFSHVYSVLEEKPSYHMEDGSNVYGQGMWAPCLRYNNDKFYVSFTCNDMHKTYVYIADSLKGPWIRQEIAGFYYDSSLLFDEDGKVYIVHGNRQIHLTELEPDLSGPKVDGLDRIIVTDGDEVPLGYEGSHIYKINGKYYVFFIHWPASGKKCRTESCFMADSIDGEFRGGDVFEDDLDYMNQGVAQGGIVDTPEGEWYGILFQDHGAVGRIPVVVPVHFENDFPVFDGTGARAHNLQIPSTRPDHRYEPLVSSDDFEGPLKDCWEFNHVPDFSGIECGNHSYQLTTVKIANNLLESVNTLTQRTLFPTCKASVTLDGSRMADGDKAGLCLLIGDYSWIGLIKEEEHLLIAMVRGTSHGDGVGVWNYSYDEEEVARVELPASWSKISIQACCDFTNMKDEVTYYYKEDESGQWKPLGCAHKMHFKLDQFVGARFGLFSYSTKTMGGIVNFANFTYS